MSNDRAPRFELRVLQGEQQGACTAVPADTAIQIGSDWDSDVVLRGLAQGPEAGVRLSLKATADGVHLVVQQGQVQAAGRSVGAGQSLLLALATPVTVGSAQIVLLRSDGPGQPDPAHPAEHAERSPTAAPNSAPTPDRYVRWPRRLLATGGALAAVSVGVLAFAYSAVPTPPSAEQQAQRAQTLLNGAAMPRLSVSADAQGVLQISGYLETLAQRAQAEQMLGAERLPRAPAAAQAHWQVWVNEAVVAAVQDVFRAKGVAAQVQAVGPGAVRVQTSLADPLLLDDLRSTARRDVPGLAALEVNNTVPAASARPVVVDDPGKRVASIVPGDPPYIVTVDGTRYFEGALLPSGHRIARIEAQQVLLEFNGVRTPLVF